MVVGCEGSGKHKGRPRARANSGDNYQNINGATIAGTKTQAAAPVQKAKRKTYRTLRVLQANGVGGQRKAENAADDGQTAVLRFCLLWA